jgi:hypothetical protein
LIRGLWSKGTDCILDVRMTDLDAKSNKFRNPDKVLATHEREKKKKYLEPCLEQRRHFSPFRGIDRWSPWQRSEGGAEETCLDAH